LLDFGNILAPNWVPSFGYLPRWFSINRVEGAFEDAVFYDPTTPITLDQGSVSSLTTLPSTVITNAGTSFLGPDLLNSLLVNLANQTQNMKSFILGEYFNIGLGYNLDEESFGWVVNYQDYPTTVKLSVNNTFLTCRNKNYYESLVTPETAWVWDNDRIFLFSVGYASAIIDDSTIPTLPDGLWSGESFVFARHPGHTNNFVTISSNVMRAGSLGVSGIFEFMYKRSGYQQRYIDILVNNSVTVTAERQKMWTSVDSLGLIYNLHRLEPETSYQLSLRLDPILKLEFQPSSQYYEAILAGAFNLASSYTPSVSAQNFCINHPKYLSLTYFSTDDITIDNTIKEATIGEFGWDRGSFQGKSALCEVFSDTGVWQLSEQEMPSAVQYSGVNIENQNRAKTATLWDADIQDPSEFAFF